MKIVSVLLLMISSTICVAQVVDSVKVVKPINDLFEAMRKGDSALLHKSFHDDVRMFTSYVSKEGKAVLEEGSLQDFLIVVGTPHNNIWDEKIWNVSIKVDDNIAHVWCDYGFYVDNEFSHCGVDAFQLVKKDGETWQIINLMDTRKSTDCFLPERK